MKAFFPKTSLKNTGTCTTQALFVNLNNATQFEVQHSNNLFLFLNVGNTPAFTSPSSNQQLLLKPNLPFQCVFYRQFLRQFY